MLHKLFTETCFDADELTVVWQSINVEHTCHYCVPAHTGIAKMMKVSEEITDALRNETPLPITKLEALRTFTIQMVRERGNATDAQIKAFFSLVTAIAPCWMSFWESHRKRCPITSTTLQ